jgi:hypothetical protein
MQETVKYASPTAPASGATAVLFNSVSALGAAKMMRTYGLTMVQVFYGRLSHDSAASGLKAYYSTDGGANWYQMDYKDSAGSSTMPKTITAPGADKNVFESFDVSMVDDFKLEHTNSANVLTAWDVVVVGILHSEAVAK